MHPNQGLTITRQRETPEALCYCVINARSEPYAFQKGFVRALPTASGDARSLGVKKERANQTKCSLKLKLFSSHGILARKILAQSTGLRATL